MIYFSEDLWKLLVKVCCWKFQNPLLFLNFTKEKEHSIKVLLIFNFQIRRLNANIEKLRSEIDKIYIKYKNARKIALHLKQITEDRTQLLKRHHKQYVQTLNEIQKYLDNALTSKTVETDKLTELIEKSTKNTMQVDELLVNDEINVVLCDIEKRLSSLEKV